MHLVPATSQSTQVLIKLFRHRMNNNGILWRELVRLRPRRVPRHGDHGRQDEADGTAQQSPSPRPRSRRGQPDDPATPTDERQHLRNAAKLLPKLSQANRRNRKRAKPAEKTSQIRAASARYPWGSCSFSAYDRSAIQARISL